jgi:broad specificity phosphatase PhoE
MKVALIIFGLLFSFQSIASATDAPYTVYLMRHAEKDIHHPDRKNPPLQKCGQKRAENLVTFFKYIDLKKVYSTDFRRTKSTATPTAKSKGLNVEIYDQNNLDIVLAEILSNKQDVLIVGHNQTTYVLAAKLAELESEVIDGAEYDRLYQVTMFTNASKYQLFQQSFKCNEE